MFFLIRLLIFLILVNNSPYRDNKITLKNIYQNKNTQIIITKIWVTKLLKLLQRA